MNKKKRPGAMLGIRFDPALVEIYRKLGHQKARELIAAAVGRPDLGTFRKVGPPRKEK